MVAAAKRWFWVGSRPEVCDALCAVLGGAPADASLDDAGDGDVVVSARREAQGERALGGAASALLRSRRCRNGWRLLRTPRRVSTSLPRRLMERVGASQRLRANAAGGGATPGAPAPSAPSAMGRRPLPRGLARVVWRQAADIVARLLRADGARRGGASVKSLTLRDGIAAKKATHAVVCDVPGFDSDNNLTKWWENDETPSRSYYTPNVTAVSCLIRDLGARPLPPELHNFTDAQLLQQSLSVERCEVVCRRVCRTVCTTDHLSVHELIAELNDWRFDPDIDTNPREFVANATLYQERHPAQYLRGVGSDTLGQEVVPLNITCTMPTLSTARHELVMGDVHAK